MGLGDLGNPRIPETGYDALTNRTLLAVEKFASDYADRMAKPEPEESNEDFSDRWYKFFNEKMRELGWEYTADHCLCEDPDFGHEPACGWTEVR